MKKYIAVTILVVVFLGALFYAAAVYTTNPVAQHMINGLLMGVGVVGLVLWCIGVLTGE